jgi:hypothetical protein
MIINKKIVKIFKNDWHYENQVNFFINCLYCKKLFKEHGKISITLYEKMWQSYIY